MSGGTAEGTRREQAPTDPPESGPIADFVERLWWFTPPLAQLLDPTPADGPDPYGNPDPEWLRIDWSEHLRTIEVPTPSYPGGTDRPTTVNYVEMGPIEGEAGQPIVFVHGLAGSWQNWLENIPHFARNHRVIALDLPGFGRSPLPSWRISIESHGRFLHDFCETLGVRDPAVVGNSMGGFISAEAVIQDHDRFTKLVLVSAAGISHAKAIRGPAVTAARMSMLVAPFALGVQNRVVRRPKVRFQMLRNLFYNPLKLRYELIYEFLHNGPGTEGFLPAVRGLTGYDFRDSLEDVEHPALIVWGRNDHIVPPTDAHGYGHRLRNSRTAIYDKTGHCAMAERPVRFNRELELFLAE
jgi:Predicted hydrolases or acyltransferases (alpha/beta hydrolase superfamily)